MTCLHEVFLASILIISVHVNIVPESIKCEENKSLPCSGRALPACSCYLMLVQFWTTHQQTFTDRTRTSSQLEDIKHCFNTSQRQETLFDQTSQRRRWQAFTRDVRNSFCFAVHAGPVSLVEHFLWLMRSTSRINCTWVHLTIAPGNLSDSLWSLRLLYRHLGSQPTFTLTQRD